VDKLIIYLLLDQKVTFYLDTYIIYTKGRKKGKMVTNPIKKRREEKGLTQVYLALLLGLSQIYISQFETGGLVPSKRYIEKITKILGINPETLDKELHQFYEDKRKELEKKVEKKKNNA
jgi:transcriptional regulator with XRE-family HTH domain